MARTKKDSVGIIGLGIMGGAFAQNLLAAGWRVIGYDIAPGRRRAIAKLGGEIEMRDIDDDYRSDLDIDISRNERGSDEEDARRARERAGF